MRETKEEFHLHLVSDATGETLNSVMRACLVQFEDIAVREHNWPLIRTEGQIARVLEGIARYPGLVLYTLVNEKLRDRLIKESKSLQVPVVAILDPVMNAMAHHFGVGAKGLPGRQHELDADYFERIEAMNFALNHDDGQSARHYDDADVILVGVSRSSKTPTCIYLANRGIKAANVPIVPNCPMPPELFQARKPLIIGLTKDVSQLIHIRRHRLSMIAQDEEGDYIDPEIVKKEVTMARRLCAEQGWPVIDVTKRSIEETAATIIQMLNSHHEKQGVKRERNNPFKRAGR